MKSVNAERNEHLLDIQSEFLAFLSTLLHLEEPDKEHYLSNLKFMDSNTQNWKNNFKSYLNLAKTGRNYYYAQNGVHSITPLLDFNEDNEYITSKSFFLINIAQAYFQSIIDHNLALSKRTNYPHLLPTFSVIDYLSFPNTNLTKNSNIFGHYSAYLDMLEKQRENMTKLGTKLHVIL